MSSDDKSYGRPVIITIVGALMILGCVALIILGIASFILKTDVLNNMEWKYSISYDTAVQLMIVQGLVYGIIGAGLIKGIKIFWHLSVIWFIIVIVAQVWGSSKGTSWVGPLVTMLINILLIFYMNTQKVKAHFGV